MNIKIKRLFERIKNKEFGYIFRRILMWFLPHIQGNFYNNHQFTYNIFVSSHWTKFLDMPKDYSYIIAGSHGVGFVAFIKYMQNLGANPMTLDNMFARSDYVLLARKHAQNHKDKLYGLSIEKAYIDNIRKNILSKLDSKVPVFCLVRDPISIFRTQTIPTARSSKRRQNAAPSTSSASTASCAPAARARSTPICKRARWRSASPS